MFSLFHERHDEEDPSEARSGFSRAMIPYQLRAHGGLIALAVAFVAVLVYGVHERSVAAHFSEKGAQAAAELKDTRAQISALTAKLDSIANAQQDAPAAQLAPEVQTKPLEVHPKHPVLHSTGQRQKPDPRWKKVQAQLDAQGKQLDAQGKAIESTRQELASARTDLEGSIAKTHEELVVLQKKGERNYFEFDLDKSKNFHHAGPVGISLRKANTKNQYADLKLLVDDRELSKKHLNLYEPVIFYPTDERQPVELVINSITKNHIHGYISAAKYRNSELTAGSTADSQSGSNAQETAAAKPRNRLDVRR
jgi:hypothetical protein